MHNTLRRRIGVFGTSGAICALGFLPGAPAYAATLSFNRVNVTTASSTNTAVNQCIRDAQDGRINSAVNHCNQVTTAGNRLILKNVDIVVYSSGTWGPSLYQSSSTDATLSGGTTDSVISCVMDARDGQIDSALVDCKIAWFMNSYLGLTDTTVEIQG